MLMLKAREWSIHSQTESQYMTIWCPFLQISLYNIVKMGKSSKMKAAAEQPVKRVSF